MGFCDVCGCREDNPYISSTFDLSKTKMKKYTKDFYYFIICDNCYDLIEAFDSNKNDVFKNFHFAKIEIERMFRSEEQIIKYHNKFLKEYDRIEKKARKRCFGFHQNDEDCQKCDNKLLCLEEN